ncbi:MAG: sterol desaturase family protein, partial [Gammaproteobacteria bacterium]
VSHEPLARGGAFALVLAAMLTAEALWARRAGPMRRRARWTANVSIVLIDTLLVRLLIPVGAAGTAAWAAQSGLGALNQVEWPAALEGLLAFLALDAAIYWQHRLFHRVPWCWRLHRMHHSDLEFDATTGVRFHPAEILLSMLIKIAVVTALGAPAIAVILFEIALNATSLFNHGNLRLPPAADRALRAVVVTPDMHRVHHSVHRAEHDSNYGFNLSWWDRLFRSYTDQPREGHAEMQIGLHAFRAEPEQRLSALLAQPFKKGSDQFSGGVR